MNKKATSLKMFMAAVATFMTVELADSPFRTLSMAAILLTVGGNFWLKAEEQLMKNLTKFGSF